MKRKSALLAIILILILIISGCNLGGGRDGSPENPYLIQGESDLRHIGTGSYGLDDHYELTQTVRAEQINDWIPKGTADRPFNGVIEGNGNIIHVKEDIKQQEDTELGGLLGYIGEKGEVRNLIIKGNLKGGSEYTGMIAGINEGTIKNVRYGNRQVTGDPWGSGNVIGEKTTGGLVGKNLGTIEQCLVIEGQTRGNYTKDPENPGGVGGLVGYNEGIIKESVAAHTVYGKDNTGGLVGYDHGGTIEDSYSHMPVDVEGKAATNIGLFIGKSIDSTIKNSYTGGAIFDHSEGYINNFKKASKVGTFGGYISMDTTLEGCVRINNELDFDYDEKSPHLPTIGSEPDDDTIMQTGEKPAVEPEEIKELFHNIDSYDFEETWTFKQEDQFPRSPLLQWELDNLAE